MSAFKLMRRGSHTTLRRLYSGPLATYIDRIAVWYIDHGYQRSYAYAALRSVDRFGRWVDRRGLQPGDIDEQLIRQYLLKIPRRAHPEAGVALGRLLAVLRDDGTSVPLTVRREPAQILEDGFRQHLVDERGLAARTIGHYTEAAHIFLAALFGQDRMDPGEWTAADVLTFVRQHAKGRRPGHMQSVCSGLRAFLRYLRLRGQTQRDLAGSIPRIARWRLATLPKFLSSKDVTTVLAHCDRFTALGRRNHAVLMLLSRLGLRANEVRSLTLDDIDWRSGQLTIRGKSRPPEPIPLPVDVGHSLSAYLTNGRPPSTSRAVFVGMKPPHLPFASSGAITTIAADAMHAAGIDAPIKGAHVFRHTLATQMLRRGSSLREIGQVLRHRDEDTTRIYAKVDLKRLRALALPWPGGAS
jgi:site-specific recombinase XerD